MEIAFIVIHQLMIFIVFALIGVIAVKAGVLSQDGLQSVSRLIIKITLPIMLFTNTAGGVTREELWQTLPVMAATVVMYLGLFALCSLLRFGFRLQGDQGRVFLAASVFGNVGFIGIPIISTLYPAAGMLYVAAFTLVDQLLMWTIGANLTVPAGRGGQSLTASLRKLINPATIAIVLAVIVILTGVQLPSALNQALTQVGATTSPLAMIYLGGMFCFMDIAASLRHKEFYGTIVAKMVLFPLVLHLVLRALLPLTEEALMTMTILAALPAMTSVAMLAQSQNNHGDYCSGCVFVTTVASVVTLPVVCLLVSLL